MFEAAGTALTQMFTIQAMAALIAGVIIGVLSGALPGGAVPTLVVLLGFAYGMDPFVALPLAIGMVSTVPTGDTLPAVLLGMPGSTSGQATILDGNPLAKQGKAGVALSAAYFASLIGGLIGAVFLFATIPMARPIVNQFGAAEFFVLGLVAIAVVGVVSSGALLRGLLVGAMGLLISTIGFHTQGTFRSTLDIDYLFNGIHIVPLVIGLFALPEFIDMIISDMPIARGTSGDMMKQATTGRREGMMHVVHNWPLVLRSAGLGVFVGLLPGIGGSLAQWLSYASARQTVRGGTETFGTGDIRGVIAPESANNAVDGGQLVPTLFFGVPGSVGMAIFLGFLIVLGLQPGPAMLDQNLDKTLTIVFSLALANVYATSLVLGFTPQLARIAFVPPNILVPLIFAVLSLAAFQANFQIADLIVMLAFGGIGFFMKTYGWPRPPIIIAVVLGGIVEKFYGITVLTYGWGMFSRIPVLAIIAIAFLTGGYTLWIQRSVAKNKAELDRKIAKLDLEEAADTGPDPAPDMPWSSGASDRGSDAAPIEVRTQLPFFARLRPTPSGVALFVLAIFFAYFFVISTWCGSLAFCPGNDWPKEAARLPRLVSIVGLSISAIYVTLHLSRAPSAATSSKIMDIGRSQTDASHAVVVHRTIKAIGSTIGFVVAIWLFGFQISVPAYIFLYLFFFGHTKWWQAAIAAGVFVVLIYSFFGGVVHVSWPVPKFGAIIPDFLKGV
jgi:TctA family transporter